MTVVLSPRPPVTVQRRGAGAVAGSLKGKKVVLYFYPKDDSSGVRGIG